MQDHEHHMDRTKLPSQPHAVVESPDCRITSMAAGQEGRSLEAMMDDVSPACYIVHCSGCFHIYTATTGELSVAVRMVEAAVAGAKVRKEAERAHEVGQLGVPVEGQVAAEA